MPRIVHLLLLSILVLAPVSTTRADPEDDCFSGGWISNFVEKFRCVRDGCTEVIERRLCTGTDLVMAYTNPAQAYAAVQMCRRAVTDWSGAIAPNPESGFVSFNRAQAHVYLGEHQLAREDFDMAIKFAEPWLEISIPLYRALSLCVAGDSDAAEQGLMVAICVVPNSVCYSCRILFDQGICGGGPIPAVT